MFTRLDYINGVCTHREYYSQFVTERVRRTVKERFTPQLLKTCFATDEHFNNIPLHKWDILATHLVSAECFKEHGDFVSKAGLVCIAKEAARQIAQD